MQLAQSGDIHRRMVLVEKFAGASNLCILQAKKLDGSLDVGDGAPDSTTDRGGDLWWCWSMANEFDGLAEVGVRRSEGERDEDCDITHGNQWIRRVGRDRVVKDQVVYLTNGCPK